MAIATSTRRSARHKRLLDLADEDPLASVANLFDAAIVLSVGLMLAIVVALRLNPTAMKLAKETPSVETTVSKDPQTGELTIQRRTAKTIARLTPSDQKLTGEGTKLGTAYQLNDGQIIYVPEK